MWTRDRPWLGWRTMAAAASLAVLAAVLLGVPRDASGLRGPKGPSAAGAVATDRVDRRGPDGSRRDTTEPEPVPDSTTYARALARYYDAAHAVARPLFLAAARAYEAAGVPDSAALAVLYYGKSYAQERANEALRRAHADTLGPWLRRLDVPLARAAEAELRGEVAYWDFDWEAAYAAYREAFPHFDTADATAALLAADNRRNVAYLHIGISGQDSTLYYGRWSLRLAERFAGPCSRAIGYAHLGLGNFYHLGGDFSRAIAHTRIGLDALDAVLPEGHPHRATTHAQLADFEMELGRYDEALASIRRAFAYAEGADAATGYSVATEYADVLYHLGLYDESLYWNVRMRDYAREAFGAGNAFLAAPTMQVASAATYAGDTAMARRYLDSALAYFEAFPAEVEFVRADYEATRAYLALARGELAAARDGYALSHRLSAERGDSTVWTLRAGLHNLANVHLELGGLDSAAYYLQRLDTVLVRIGADGEAPTVWSVEHLRLAARVATARGDYPAARRHLRAASASLGVPGGRGALLVKSFDLAGAAERLYGASADGADAALVLDYAALVERALDEEYAFLGGERWDSAFVADLRRVFTTAAFLAAERAGDATTSAGADGADWTRRAIRYADLPRALRLRRRGAEALAATAARLPDSLRERGRQLRQELAAMRFSTLDAGEREAATAALRTAVAEHEDALRRGYPTYYRALANPLRLDVDALAARAREDGSEFVSFLVDTARGRLLVTGLGSRGPVARATPWTPALQAATLSLKRLVTRRTDHTEDDVAAAATSLYDALLRGLWPEGAPPPVELVIASEGVLADLPFAALLADVPEPGAAWGAWPWLGVGTAVRHVDALASVGETGGGGDARDDAHALSIASLAPGFDLEAGAVLAGGKGAGAKLLRTPWTLELTEALGERYGATVRTRAEATEAAFAELYATHEVVHLGTHALLDDGAPLRSFFALTPGLDGDGGRLDGDDGRLHAYELYGMDGAARLAVLPACYSGAGRYSAAEGTESLATALRNSGCETVVQARWQLDDQQTSVLIAHFYAALADGAPVAEALALARRRFLAQAPAELQHPFYWAGLAAVGPSVSFGETEGSRKQSPAASYWWLLGLVPLAVGVYAWRRRVHL